jgi:TPR repeat protein
MRAACALCILHLVLAPGLSAQAPTAYDTNELVNAAHQLNADDLPRLQARAESGEGRAQVLLGLAYEMGGAGLKKQPPMALSWFLKAADQGITWAQVWTADFYLSGTDGIERDVNKALILYKSAAEHGDAKAPFFIGQIYFYGDGVAADQQEAAAWYRRARASDVPVVESMIALTATPCASAFCVGFRQVVAAIMTESANRFIDGWDEVKHEWDSTITLPESERCGLTSADRTNAGEVQNYFCDSAQVADEARGIANAKQLADAVQSALPGGYSRRERTDMRPGPSTFFEMENFPHIRVTFNVTPGSAQNRVTLLVGP